MKTTEMNWLPRGRAKSIVTALLTHSLTRSGHLSLGEEWMAWGDENRGKSMRDILPNIFEFLKEQQYMENVVHHDLGYKLYILRRGRQFKWTKTTQENRSMHAKRLLKKLKNPEEEECL
ncbi:unnamed protein product [Hymenolepis diminuta]|uniref:Transposase n=1 Tax=Hymenolepis diminuta TaxID=6216 RepID=A0A0R3SIB0_HYMDI|nr:unnamed protein product [Hymenolepis diminuta]